METPITNIAVVCDKAKAPRGYTAITLCPCGHSAQLWEKVIGGEDGTRYLCYTKEEQEDGMVLEEMFVPGPSQQYLRKNFKILKDTVEKQEPFYHKQLAYKRVPKSEAKKVIVDLIVCRAKDNISKLYTKLSKMNSLRIAYRAVDYDPNKVSVGGSGGGGENVEAVSSKMGQMSVQDWVSFDEPHPTPPLAQSTTHSSGSNLAPSSPPPTDPPPPSNPPATMVPPPQDDAVRVKVSPTLGSAPPPSSSPPVSTSYYTPQSPPTTYSAAPTPYPTPSSSTTTPYPPPPAAGGAPTLYQPTGGGALPYAMNPVGPAFGMGYSSAPNQVSYSSAGYDSGRGYPPPPPSSNVGYDTSIGFSFGSGGAAGSSTAPPPYNPYHHQQQQQQPAGYPPTGAPPQGNYGAPAAPPPQGNQHNYGFNI